MRSNVYARKLRALSKATALITLAGLASACSNDVVRLDTMTTASVKQTPNQLAIIRSKSHLQQPFPGDVRSTGSIAVAETNETLETINTVQRPVYQAPAVRAPIQRAPVPAVQVAKRPAVHQPVTVAQSGPIVLQPRQVQRQPLRIAGTDQVVTHSIRRVETPAVAVKRAQVTQVPVTRSAGWDTSKGTWVTMRSGETLFNMSRRYGVPVAAIMKANKIIDGNSVDAGRKILIPTYNYASSAPVSAPDSDPITKASRASRGFQGQARGKVAVPTARIKRPKVNVAAVTTPSLKLPTVKKPLAVGSHYTVQPGDTLSGIAARSGVSVAAIKQANGMSSDVVRLGQRLVVPNGTRIIASNVDTMSTGSIPKSSKKAKTVKPEPRTSDQVAALSNTSSQALESSTKRFRWPAEGRILSKFGERNATGSNDGIDISMPEGTPVRATEGGTVIYSGSELEDFGKLILVSHAGGWVSAYAHASSTLVRRGEKVRRGQVIAKSGKTGNATVPMLHFELRKDSNPVNPLKHLAR